MKTATKLIIASVFLSAAFLLAYAGTASAATQVTLTGTDLSRVGTHFNKIASGEGLITTIYTHFGNATHTASRICALTATYYSQLGLDKPYIVYVKKTGLGYVSCWNDYNYIWKNGAWVKQGACTIGSMLRSVTCESATITCSTNSECGTSGYVDSPVCQNGDVFQNYRTYTCNNPGTASSSCSNSIALQQKQDCTANQTCSAGSCVNQNITCST
ncbi:MAG: hypothetical protein AAB509_00415, partial [Patescibacteria group bacterium]